VIVSNSGTLDSHEQTQNYKRHQQSTGKLTMASTSLRSMTLRRFLRSSTLSSARINPTVSVATRTFASGAYKMSEREQKFVDMGWMDDRGLTLFKTLHENQVRSCAVFADNELYGKYNPDTQKFEYSTYREFGQQVNRARHVLKDLGEHSMYSFIH
jgi:hypothetical protein